MKTNGKTNGRIYVEFIDVDELIPSKFNPPNRTDPNLTTDLQDSMVKYGFWTCKPIEITKDNVIADGHRRWAAAKELGIKEVPCLRTNLDNETAWVENMSANKKITSQELFQAYLHGLRKYPENSTGKMFSRQIAKYGEKLIIKVARAGLSSSTIVQAQRVCDYVGWEREHVPEVVDWIIHNKQNKVLWIAISSNYSPKDLIKNIANNKPITFK